MIRSADIGVVFQGSLGPAGVPCEVAAAGIAATRSVLPEARIVLSIWKGEHDSGLPVDEVVYSDDPGPLPPFKSVRGCGPNNLNRQIVTAQAGIARIERPYTLKMRLDARLQHCGLLEWYAKFPAFSKARARIAVSNLFTVDPRMFEQMPFHISDWFQFGPTQSLQELWRVAPMTAEDATYYDRHPHAPHSTAFDRRYRARFAVEQHIWRAYAARLGYSVPDYLNDDRPAVLAAHDRFVRDELIVLSAAQSGVVVDKYRWAERSGFQRFNCIGFSDWRELNEASRSATDAGRSGTREVRLDSRRLARRLGRVLGAAGPLLRTPPLRPLSNGLFRCVAWWADWQLQRNNPNDSSELEIA